MNFHENIIRFCGITIKNQDDNSKKYLLVMEYADSASAVSYLHDKGIVHHNLHSNNVLVHQDYIKIYTDCWNDEPNNRPIINEVIVKLKSIISNQLSK
ncbi:unnamed protein product [Rhizophagus irregularis]|nr:unnamed protein product [Rhizophagus irregularis]